jgi:L-rhamnose mutarotase
MTMDAEAPRSMVSIDSLDVKRYAFILKLRPGTQNAYDKAHESVPPELIALLKRVGISEYSIFRRDRLLFLALTVGDFERAWQEIERDPAYKTWQKIMEPFFEAVSDLRPGERFPMMDEVFYLP